MRRDLRAESGVIIGAGGVMEAERVDEVDSGVFVGRRSPLDGG